MRVEMAARAANSFGFSSRDICLIENFVMM